MFAVAILCQGLKFWHVCGPGPFGFHTPPVHAGVEMDFLDAWALTELDCPLRLPEVRGGGARNADEAALVEY